MLKDGLDVDFLSPEVKVDSSVSTSINEDLFSYFYDCLANPEKFNLEKVSQLLGKETSPSRIVFAVYSASHKRILVTRNLSSNKWTIGSAFSRVLKHPRLKELVENEFYLQIDIIDDEPISIDFYRVGMKKRGDRHFEIGVDGVLIKDQKEKLTFFLPGDAYVRSIMSMKQLRTYLHDAYGEQYLRRCDFYKFKSDSFLIGKGGVNKLYRGIPHVGKINQDRIEESVNLAIDHIKLTQRDNGKFLYYFDPVKDSYVDFEHPNRNVKLNPYYNILRHSGGGLTCLYYEKFFSTGKMIDSIKLAIDYLITQSVFYDVNNRKAAYIYSEKKSKLGGAGIALYLVAEYQLLTGDQTYQYYLDALAWHTLSQITESGEFIYYNVYLDKVVGEADNHKYFSFYYPGEAVCGLAKYLHTVEQSEREIFFEKIKKAMDFLIIVRPETRASEYTEVPSDSWLMMGIMELWDFPEMQNPLYSDFVFSDANIMIQQMYKVTDSPYPDYAGSFYYEFGDYPYSDGARMEGLLGAYELAVKMNDQEKADELWRALKLGAWSLMHLVNFKESMYPFRNPELGLGGIRFKFTRQWFRIDTIQHVGCFYAKFLKHWVKREGQG